jgi:hypothetical protein
MKAILATALLTAVTASSALADVQLETRAFHSNLRIDAGKITSELPDGEIFTDRISEDFFNTAGLGVAAVTAVNDVVEFGVGLSLARYYLTTVTQMDQTVLNGFTRLNLAQTESSKFYVLAGVSRQQLSQDVKDNEFVKTDFSYTPIVNGDLGLGGSIKLGSADLGLEYKYSNTLGRGRATLKSTFSIPGFEEFGVGRSKSKIHDIVLEGQEVALTLGMRL